MTNRSQKSGQRTAICHLSLVICQISLICGREKKGSAGFQPANGPVDAKGVIQAHMPARRQRYDSFSRPVSVVKEDVLNLAGEAVTPPIHGLNESGRRRIVSEFAAARLCVGRSCG